MSRSNWLHIFAVGGFVALALIAEPRLADAQEPSTKVLAEPKKPVEGITVPNNDRNDKGADGDKGNREKPATPKLDQRAPTPPAVVKVGPPARDESALNAAGNCDEACQRDKDDLKAQEDMARAAWWMVVVSAFGTLFSIVGVILVWMNLRETQKVSAQSSRSADAAILAAEAAVRAADAERGYVYITPEFHVIRHQTDPASLLPPLPKAITARFALFNYGRSQVILKSVAFEVEPIRYPNEPDNTQPMEDIPFETAHFLESDAEWGSGSKRLAFEADDEMLALFVTGQVYIWVYGRVMYEDIGGKQRMTRFRWLYSATTDTFAENGGKPYNERT